MSASNSAESVLLRTRTSTPCCYRSASHDAAPRHRSESDEGSGRRCWSQKTRTLLRRCRRPWCDEGRHDGPRNEVVVVAVAQAAAHEPKAAHALGEVFSVPGGASGSRLVDFRCYDVVSNDIICDGERTRYVS
jgi:hypothetical protein